MKKRGVFGGMAAAAAMSLMIAAPAYAKENTIPQGIFVGGSSLGGMTEAEAKEEIQAYVDSLAARPVILKVDGEAVETTAGELGLSWENPEAVQEAAGHAVTGNLVQQYMGLKDLEKEPVEIPLETAVNEESLAALVAERCQGLTAEPQNAAITRVDGRFEITPEVVGMAVDTQATKAALDEALAGEGTDSITVEAVLTQQEPEITEEDLATIGDVLGTFSTDFSSSGSARSKNLSTGAGKINGHVLMPGETLSGYECMHPFTEANGYYAAASYENGQVVDSIGGGVCQIATTLYNAALQAELEITQRQNHSMIVTYVKPSMDAAIAGTVKDIKVTNNYSTPIYVEGYTEGRTLTFTFYGKETRPANRKVEYVSETLKRIDPGAPETRVDNSLAPGTRRQVQSSHTGLQSRLWKVVTVDGVETERTLLHTDSYNASKAIVLVGPTPAPAAPAETPPVQAEGTPAQSEPAPAQTQEAVVEGVDGGPGVATEQPAQNEAVPAQNEGASAAGSASAETPAPAPTPAPEPDPAPEPAPDAAPAA